MNSTERHTMISFHSGIVRIRNHFEQAKSNILSDQFDAHHWADFNLRQFNSMNFLFQNYISIANPNVQITRRFNIFRFYWQHVNHCFMRETDQWKREHLNFLDEQITALFEIGDLIESDLLIA